MPAPFTCRRVPWVLVWAILAAVLARPGQPHAEGLLEGVSGDVETIYSLFSSRTTGSSGTFRTESNNYSGRTNLRLNHDIFPKINVNAGTTYEKNVFVPSGPDAQGQSEVTRFRPYIWLNLRDPLLTASVGYDHRDEEVKNPGQATTTLTQETYNAGFTWRPDALPSTQFRYTRTSTRDDPRIGLDTQQDLFFLKSEYAYRGLTAYYTGTYLDTVDNIRNTESSQLSHEGKVSYGTTLLEGRVSLSTDNSIRVTRFENTIERPLPPLAGLSSISDTPLTDTLNGTPGLIDGDKTTSAGINIGYPGVGGDFRRRSVGLDFLTPVQVSTLQVWVTGYGPGNLPADLVGAFSWDIYTSTDNVTWTFHTTVPVATFGPFDQRFEINFAPVTTRFVKVVTKPLSGAIFGTTNSALFPNVLVTELQSFVNRPPEQSKTHTTQTVQNYNLSIRANLFRSPSLYYQFTGSYYQIDPDAKSRYSVSNGLFFVHRFTPILSASANASMEAGQEEDQSRVAVLYGSTLTATPLRALTDSLVFSGSKQWVGGTTTTTNSAVLYNTAQLYKGIDVNLNLGALFTSEERAHGATSSRDLYVNVGTGISPHPSLTLTTYYLGKLRHLSDSGTGQTRDTIEHRLDMSLSFTPFRTLTVAAAASVASQTDAETRLTHNYSLSWAPFPEGTLQFTFFYSESFTPDETRLIQPAIRWYLTSKRRSYLEASYQRSTSEAGTQRTESQVFSTSLKVYF